MSVESFVLDSFLECWVLEEVEVSFVLTEEIGTMAATNLDATFDRINDDIEEMKWHVGCPNPHQGKEEIETSLVLDSELIESEALASFKSVCEINHAIFRFNVLFEDDINTPNEPSGKNYGIACLEGYSRYANPLCSLLEHMNEVLKNSQVSDGVYRIDLDNAHDSLNILCGKNIAISFVHRDQVSFSALREEVVNVLDFMERLKNEEDQKAVDVDLIEKLKLKLTFICTYVQLSYSDFDQFEDIVTGKRQEVENLLRTILDDVDNTIRCKYNVHHVLPSLADNMDDCISSHHRSKSDGTMMEEQLNFLLLNLHHLAKYRAENIYPLVTKYGILQNVCANIGDFHGLIVNDEDDHTDGDSQPSELDEDDQTDGDSQPSEMDEDDQTNGDSQPSELDEDDQTDGDSQPSELDEDDQTDGDSQPSELDEDDQTDGDSQKSEIDKDDQTDGGSQPSELD
ncbi:putative late blight resistance protein -like protein R1B-17-like [Capsicum annuum]|nr:putative late blight resistance protein -like protein R1B-17-like [Capsicum annuum]